jgi:GAF domain-containing protein
VALARLVVPSLADWCAVDVVEEDGTVRRLAVEHEDPEKVALAYELQRRYPTPADTSRGVPRVLETGEPEMMEEIPDELLVQSVPDKRQLGMLKELGLWSYMIVPMIARGRTLGAITLAPPSPGGATDQKTWRGPRPSSAARRWPWTTPGSTRRPSAR